MDTQPDRLTRTRTTLFRARFALAGLLATLTVLVGPGVAWGIAQQPSPSAPQPTSSTSRSPLSASQLESYVARVARAWEPYTTADGRVSDPLNPADTGDNYGVILLADVMLKEARSTDDSALEAAGARILESVLTLPAPNDPFNLFAIAAVIHDGQVGLFPTRAWEQLGGPLMLLAGQIGPPMGVNCLTELGCYSNWQLVWSAGAALLEADDVAVEPGSLAGENTFVAAQIDADLQLAVTHAGTPLLSSVASGLGTIPGKHANKTHKQSVKEAEGTLTSSGLGGGARELSDPGAEPAAYELFSTFMLELLGEVDPGAITPAVARLRRQADRYALDMMAPDGQLSLSGRSLDQSWVQAAAAALGSRQAALKPTVAPVWRTFADRAVSYLQEAYPLQPDGLLPIVPGLALDWSPSIMDGYAALNQYEGLTLWLLSDALERWPSPQAPRASLPADGKSLLADDLASSGLVWGRADDVWWELSGRSTSGDPRDAQGLVAVKVDGAGDWRDLLALRPIHRGLPSSVWTLEHAHKWSATATFEEVRGTGRSVVLSGEYRRANGRVVARATWKLSTTATGVRVSMSVPAKDTLHTTVWLAGGNPQLSAPGATKTLGRCMVTASGRACPVTVYWPERHAATLEIAAPREAGGNPTDPQAKSDAPTGEP
ncbi:MAG TPA: hypothetical protein VIJ33_10030 [Solirubrobacteraceae bacterium]